MNPDLFGEFIITLIGKGYKVIIDKDPVVDGVKIHIIKYEAVPYHVVRTITFDELNFMTKDVQKRWFDYVIELVEVEFFKIKTEK